VCQVVPARGVVRRGRPRRPNGCPRGCRFAAVRAVESFPGSLLADRLAAGDERALAEAFDGLGTAVHATALQVLGDAAAA
jgi:hypothetical protein